MYIAYNIFHSNHPLQELLYHIPFCMEIHQKTPVIHQDNWSLIYNPILIFACCIIPPYSCSTPKITAVSTTMALVTVWMGTAFLQ